MIQFHLQIAQQVSIGSQRILLCYRIICDVKNNKMTTSKNIVALATESAKTLAAAVKAAELVSTLEGAGPFTVFAPTDAAFAAIQKDVDSLLKPENKSKLADILTYHVVSGTHMAADLKDGTELTTVQGGKLKVSVKDHKVMIGEAHVTAADVHASNGVVHLIDKVLLPKAQTKNAN